MSFYESRSGQSEDENRRWRHQRRTMYSRESEISNSCLENVGCNTFGLRQIKIVDFHSFLSQIRESVIFSRFLNLVGSGTLHLTLFRELRNWDKNGNANVFDFIIWYCNILILTLNPDAVFCVTFGSAKKRLWTDWNFIYSTGNYKYYSVLLWMDQYVLGFKSSDSV